MSITQQAAPPPASTNWVPIGPPNTPGAPVNSEIAYDQITANVSVTGTLDGYGSTTAVIAGSAHTYDGTPVIAEFYSDFVSSGSAGSTTVICLFDGSTQICRMARNTATGGSTASPFYPSYRFTPSAGTHTYNIRAFTNGGGTGTIEASDPSVANSNAVPTYLRISRVLGVPGPPGPGTASYGTTLPATPYDGQEAILVDSVTAPTYQWRFRYNAGSTSAYKWEFIGGAMFLATVETSEVAATPVATWFDLTTLGPDFVAPRAGEYFFECRANIYVTSATGNGSIAVAIPETAVPTSFVQSAFSTDVWGHDHASGWNKATMTAGQKARVRYMQSVANVYFRYRRFTVLPMRVS